eukprot:gb/GECH01010721.1/.p1 GENE.gb/GECH01010721.1/~~gb/GECH01010721.1/.p1  ORF type:complete len:144 (+),score=13.93 gb/GECH01010721.1/:1-432(+)
MNVLMDYYVSSLQEEDKNTCNRIGEIIKKSMKRRRIPNNYPCRVYVPNVTSGSINRIMWTKNEKQWSVSINQWEHHMLQEKVKNIGQFKCVLFGPICFTHLANTQRLRVEFSYTVSCNDGKESFKVDCGARGANAKKKSTKKN